jgi:excisionase family DNA binding protein
MTTQDARSQLGTRSAMPKLLLTAEDAAEVLSVGRSTVYELIRLGVLDSVKIGKARRVPVTAVQEYVDRLVMA